MQAPDIFRMQPIAGEDTAREITNQLYRHVHPGVVDVNVILEMYDWVRESNFAAGETIDVTSLARKWEARPGSNDLEWLTRAFD
jgi:hypothetical protein